MALPNVDYNKKRDFIIEKCYECFVERGIENTSVRNLCDATKLNANTLYYYFNDKEDILFECIHYGYRQYEKKMFEAIDEAEVTDIISNLIKLWVMNSREIRFFFQSVSSPVYDEERLRQFPNGIYFDERIGIKLSRRLGCPYEAIRTHVTLLLISGQFLSLWGDDENGFDASRAIFQDILKVAEKEAFSKGR